MCLECGIQEFRQTLFALLSNRRYFWHLKYRKMKKQVNEKKFNLEKFEVAKLKNLRKIFGGKDGDGDGNVPTGNVTTGDDQTITDLISLIKTK